MGHREQNCSACGGRGYINGPSLIAGIGTDTEFCIHCDEPECPMESSIPARPSTHFYQPVLGALARAAALRLTALIARLI